MNSLKSRICLAALMLLICALGAQTPTYQANNNKIEVMFTIKAGSPATDLEYLGSYTAQVEIFRGSAFYGSFRYPDQTSAFLDPVFYIIKVTCPPFKPATEYLDLSGETREYIPFSITLAEEETYLVVFKVRDAFNNNEVKNPAITFDREEAPGLEVGEFVEAEYSYIVKHSDYYEASGKVMVGPDMETPIEIKLKPIIYKLTVVVKNSYGENVSFGAKVDGVSMGGGSKDLRKGSHSMVVTSEGISKSDKISLTKNTTKEYTIDPPNHYKPSSSKTFSCAKNSRKSLSVTLKYFNGTTSSHPSINLGTPRPGVKTAGTSITVAGIVKYLSKSASSIKWVVVRE